MTAPQPSIEDFFNNTGGGVGAPSAQLSAVDDFVYGTVVDQALIDKKKYRSEEIEVDSRTGEKIKQLVVVIQTENRNWAGVSKVPTDENGHDKPTSDDDGRRAIYVPPFTNIHAAIGAAIIEATGQKGPIRNGATLGVKVVELKDTGKGKPLKIHQARYVAPAESDGFFGDQNAATTTEAAPPARPAAPPAAAPPVDPWTGAPAGANASKPPF